MGLIKKIYSLLKPSSPRTKETSPPKAYDIWSTQYDQQPHNLMLALDEQLFAQLLAEVSIQNKIIADIGCGTGRHWPAILQQGALKITGFDVSEGMLAVLKQKFPDAETHLVNNHLLPVSDSSFDLLVSTLAIAHIKDLTHALVEWHRVLKPGGSLLITDYHPAAIAGGGQRTFTHNKRLVAVKNYIHPVDRIKTMAKQFGFKEVSFRELFIDDHVKHWYEKQNALALFEKFRGMPIIFGIHLKKDDAAS